MFSTPLTTDGSTIHGPFRHPKQMLAEQVYDDHLSVHDEANASALGLAGAPIEGPTHFSQFDPLGHEVWNDEWFRSGCISAHFSTMVVEGEQVQASAVRSDETNEAGRPTSLAITATKSDGAVVLTGTMSVAPHGQTALEERLANARPAGDLHIVDQLAVGMRSDRSRPTTMDMSTSNGALYPFSLRAKLDAITEHSSWYESDDNPWGRPIIPLEMMSVLANKIGDRWPIRQPSLGLFLDLEVRVLGEPLFVDAEYLVDREIVGLSQSRRVESYWTRSTLTDAASGRPAAVVLLHSGVFKDSYPGYPSD